MAQYSNGRERPRNAGPTPPDKPTPRNEKRTPNPNAYESSADIVARRNAENARRSPIAPQRSANGTQYFEKSNPIPQMPEMPRGDLRGLVPLSPNDIRTPFHYYPDLGNGHDPQVSEGFLGDVVGSAGLGRAMTPEEEMALAYEIMKSMQSKQGMSRGFNDYGIEDEMNNQNPGPMRGNSDKWYNHNPLFIPDGRSVYDHLKEDAGNAWRSEGDWVEKNLPSFKGFFGR